MLKNEEIIESEHILPDPGKCHTYRDIPVRLDSRVKGLLDIVSAALELVLLVVMLAIFIDNPGPVFFSQYRVGLEGKPFKMVKFRSMRVDAPHELSTAEVRDPKALITRMGRFIRKYSIDELPQLYNVVVGDMSIVGLRPLILKRICTRCATGTVSMTSGPA